ncbi:hypothetical protein ACWGB8_38020 [Kitasatospora sp. NPDC054939]
MILAALPIPPSAASSVTRCQPGSPKGLPFVGIGDDGGERPVVGRRAAVAPGGEQLVGDLSGAAQT